MVQGTGRNNGSKGRLLAGWWKRNFGLIMLLGLLMGMIMAQVKSPEQERFKEGKFLSNIAYNQQLSKFSDYSDNSVNIRTRLSKHLILIEPHWGRTASIATGVSEDGKVVVGYSLNAQGGSGFYWRQWDYNSQRAFYWTLSEGTQDLGSLEGERTWANAVSSDGKVIVGGYYASGYISRAFRWTRDKGMQDLGTLEWYTDALDCSADGSTIVGSSYGSCQGYWGVFAFLWTFQTGLQCLGALPGYRFTHAYGISFDGSIVVGESNKDWAPYWHEGEAWLWTKQHGMQGLGVLPPWGTSAAREVSDDGSTVIGVLYNNYGTGDDAPWINPHRAFRWRKETGLQDLGTLGGERTNVFHAVTYDGKVIFGKSQTVTGEWRAFRWTEYRGMEDINELYASIIPSGWTLRDVIDCSSDGRYLVGWAEGPNGVIRAFLLNTGGLTNYPPSIPILLSPSEGSTVSPTLTFKVKSVDPNGDNVKYVIEVTSGNDARTFETGFYPSGQEATYTVPSNRQLSAGQWSWRAKAIDSKGLQSGWSQSQTFTVNVTNNPPSTPVLLSPVNQTVSPVPTFKLKSDDPDNDQVMFIMEVKQGGILKSFQTGFYSSGVEVTYSDSKQPLSDGQWQWRAKARDKRGAESGWSEWKTFTVQSNLPDLVPIDLKVTPDTVRLGNKVTVSFKVLNQGRKRANASKTRIILSKSASEPSSSDPLLKELSTPALDPNKSQDYSESVVIPADIQTGDYYVWVVVDVDKTSGQGDDTNDKAKFPIKVQEKLDYDVLVVEEVVRKEGGKEIIEEKPVAGARIIVFDENHNIITEGTTNREGKAKIPALKVGHYIRAEKYITTFYLNDRNEAIEQKNK
jgi:probable HAF family extracellular repeat protein